MPSLDHKQDHGAWWGSQESQYTSEQFQRLQADIGITCAMSRAGNIWDNSTMESVFLSQETRRSVGKARRTRDKAKLLP
jgi:putative transposase